MTDLEMPDLEKFYTIGSKIFIFHTFNIVVIIKLVAASIVHCAIMLSRIKIHSKVHACKELLVSNLNTNKTLISFFTEFKTLQTSAVLKHYIEK